MVRKYCRVSTQMIRAIRTLSILVGLIANLIPLYGVLYWQWDSFQLLMLYWMETVIIAFWTIRADHPPAAVDELGTITVDGRGRDRHPTDAVRLFHACCRHVRPGAPRVPVDHVLRRMAQEGARLRQLPARVVRRRRALAGADLHVRLGMDFLSAQRVGGLSARDGARDLPPRKRSHRTKQAAMPSARSSADCSSASSSCRSRSSSAACSQELRLDRAAPDRHRPARP